MRWVKSNIENFLGDPNNVTIFGESAGSAAVQYLILSPLSKGLFHKAIMQSGSALNQWASGSNNKENISQILNLKTTDEKEILETLRELPVEKLFEVQQKLEEVVHKKLLSVQCDDADFSREILLEIKGRMDLLLKNHRVMPFLLKNQKIFCNLALTTKFHF